MAKLRYILIILIAVFASACSTTKFLGAGQKLYTGGVIKITDKQNTKSSDAKAMTADLKSLLRPAPNSTILGLRFKLWVYNKTKTNKVRGLRHYLNTHFGEPPVLINSVDLVKNSSILQNRLQNKGFFLAQVSGDTVSKMDYQQALRAAQISEAIIYSIIVVPIEASAGRDTGGEHALIQLSEDTGGKYYYATSLAQLDQAFKNISDELRTQYLLAYYPSQRLADSDFRRIEVKLASVPNSDDYKTRHRTGYYTSKSH